MDARTGEQIHTWGRITMQEEVRHRKNTGRKSGLHMYTASTDNGCPLPPADHFNPLLHIRARNYRLSLKRTARRGAKDAPGYNGKGPKFL